MTQHSHKILRSLIFTVNPALPSYHLKFRPEIDTSNISPSEDGSLLDLESRHQEANQRTSTALP